MRKKWIEHIAQTGGGALVHSYKVNSSHSFFVDCMMDFTYNLSRNFVPNFHERKKRKMKHRVLSILLALTFLVSVCLFCTSAFAATGAQDGVTAELTTDKAEYAAGESINVTLLVTNTNVRVNNLRTELVLPAGVTLTTGALVNEGATMAPGTEAKFEYGLTVDAAEVPTTTPGGDNDGPAETGDYSMIIFGMLAAASLVGLIALTGMKNIFKQRWFVLVLCGALLLGVAGPIAATAAATKKTFEVTENVTLAGVAAELKAIVSYDLNDEVVHTEEVAFKKDGQFLWAKEVEQGYYLGSDISWNGQTTSKDGSYRPEVNAPYIDMLFGCTSILDNKYYPGEVKNDIFNADATQTALIGLTKDPASRAALDMIGTDEWIITVIDGKLVVTGWYDNATVAAVRALNALASVDAADINLTLPMIGKMNYVAEAPAFTAGKFLGAMDSDFGAVIMRYNEIEAADFDAYCATLEAAGYELYESNTLDGWKDISKLRFATYVKGEDAVLVQYLPMGITLDDPANMTSAEKKAYESSCYMDGTSIRVILTRSELLVNNAAANTGWTDAGITPKLHLLHLYDKHSDGNNIGQCQIFTLADGSFIVVDGGSSPDAENVYKTLKEMNEREDGKIVVAAWILTHAHGDHTGALGTLAATEEWAKEITIEQMVLNHVAVSYRYRSTGKLSYRWENAFSAEFASIREVTSKFAQGENYKLIMPHMGQIMKIRNAEIEFLTVGDEDMFPILFTNDNAQSMVFRVTYPTVTDQEIMIVGDSALDQTYNVYFPLMPDELHADILQVAHHGLGGQTSRFYPMFKNVKVAIWPTDWKTINKNNLLTSSTNAGLQAFNPLNIVCEEYVQTLNIPFNKDTDHILRTKLTSYSSKFQDAKMDISMLPTFRFQNQWGKAEAQAKIISYLKKYSADIMILPLIDQNSTNYNKADLVNGLYDALDYNYIYYAPVWDTSKDATGNFETGDNTMGHLILSVYPIRKAETKILVEGNTTAWANPEGRGYAHVLLDVEGVPVDLVATHFNDKGNWTKFAETYEQWGKYTIIAGNTKIGGNVANAGIELSASAFGEDVSILASEGITFADSKTDNGLSTSGGEFFIHTGAQKMYTTTATFSLYIAPEETTTPVRQAFVNWWVNTWGRDFGSFQKVVKTLKEVNPAVVAFHMVNHEALGMTEEQVKAELGYPYALWVPNSATADGKWSGHYLVSHYPIEDLGVLEVSNGSDDAADQYKQRRAFGHAVVTIDGTEVDVWFGSVGPGAPKQVAKLEAAVNATATETGRPFIISTNDAGMKDVKSFAGYSVYNYWTSYETNVLVSEGKVAVTGTETKDAGVGWAGVDVMNILDIEVKKSPAILNWWAGNWGGSNDKFETIMADVRAQNLPIVTFQQINNELIGATDKQIAQEAGYENYYYLHCHNKADGTHNGHMILTHYPIEVQEDIILRAPDAAPEGRSFGHVVVDIYGTKVDVYFGATDWLSEEHMKALEVYVAKFAAETGRPFIVSANDMPSQDVTSFGGVEVYNYRTGYVSAVLVSKGALEVTKTETIKSAASGGAIDEMNIIRFEVTGSGLTPGDPYEPPVTPEPDPDPEVPEVPEGTPVTLKTLEWWCNFGGGTTEGQVDEIVNFMKNGNFDVAVLTHWSPKYFTDESVFESFTKELGFDHYAYVTEYNAAGDTATAFHVLLSKYPIIESKQVSGFNGSDAVRAFGKAVLDINGLAVDAFWGFFGGTATDEQRAQVEADIAAARTSDSFIFLGGQFKAYTEYAGAKVSQQSTGNSIVASEGITMANGKTIAKADIGPVTAARASIDPPIYAELTVYIPEKEEPKNETVSFIEWWGVGFSKTTEATAAWLADPANHADIVALVHSVNYTEEQALALAEAAGYPHAVWVSCEKDGSRGPQGHLLMSVYPITLNEIFVLVEDAEGTASPEGRTFGYATVDVNGTAFDVFFGENNSGAQGSAQNQEKVEPWVKEKVAAAGNAYTVTGYNFTRQDYPAFTAENYATVSNSSGSILAPNGIVSMANQGTKAAGLGGDEPVYAELTFAAAEKAEETIEIEKLNVISWWCSYKAGFNNGTNRQNAIAMLTAQNADILVLSNINLTEGAGTAEAEAAAYGYAYYEFVAFDTAADPNLGTLLMSKYPFTFVEEFTAGKNFKLVQYKFNGQTLDFFFGGDADYDALAAKVKAVQETNKNAFIVALKGAPQTLAGKLTGLTDAEGKAVTMFSAFWGSSNGVLVSSPMTATEVPINPLTNGFATTNGMGDRAILAPVIFP